MRPVAVAIKSRLLAATSVRLRLRLHWSQNRHNTANQHLSGYPLQEYVATFKHTATLEPETTTQQPGQTPDKEVEIKNYCLSTATVKPI